MTQDEERKQSQHVIDRLHTWGTLDLQPRLHGSTIILHFFSFYIFNCMLTRI